MGEVREERQENKGDVGCGMQQSGGSHDMEIGLMGPLGLTLTHAPVGLIVILLIYPQSFWK